MNCKKIIMMSMCTSLMCACGSQTKFSKLALGGESVPVGEYASKILKYFELDEEALAKKGLITYGADVKEVTTQVKQGLVSAGIIYATDAKSASLTSVDMASKEMCGQVIYPAALTKNANYNPAYSFLTYLTGEAAMAIFSNVGFSKVHDKIAETAQVSENVELNIFAAASLTETMNQIKSVYEAQHSNITLSMNFGSSGKLQTQIEEGAACDIFISAGQKQMNNIDAQGGTQETKNFINHSTRIDLLENKIVLAVPDNNPAQVKSFADLKDKLIEASK